ncbi:MAG: DUF4238 domain-containing protein [Acidobacteria bacterium]|nr:MAG: DUF4238 domain-containing protein [Acidobacteriota bacterium]
MAMTVVTTRDELGFITSDQPCVWWNPEAYKRPPFFRSPGLAQKAIEVILPLGSHRAILISHHHERPLYAHLNREGTDEINRIVRFHCHEEFVSWKGETRPIWFDPGVAPDDAWENTPEAKTAAAKPEAPARL